MDSKKKQSHFETLQSFSSDISPAKFELLESTCTGMRVVVVDQKGPKVHGYFVLATEIHDDSGAPHTLEHLIFLGSKSYQYKGLLDKLATRAYSYTNAWTDTDHTAYTLETAGWEGFAQILPVYLEHVLLPTLTDSGCYTEVHHISPLGEDAGVVYSEMQGTQNTPASLVNLKASRTLYPKSVGYRYETGGLMENLRILTAKRIRDFHQEMYQPKNLCVVLIGEVDKTELRDILDKFESSILGHVPRLDEPFKRPWVSSGKTDPLEKSTVEIVDFPEDDESVGEITIAFFGPAFEDDLNGIALSVFLSYICGSSASLLENSLVEKEQLASAVFYYTQTRPDELLWFSMTGVETESLEKVEQRFHEVLKEASNKPLDMEYLNDCLRRAKRQVKFLAESDVTFFAESIIEEHLFGPRDGTSLRRIAQLEEYETLEQWDEENWKRFMLKWLVNAHHASIIAKPSQKLAKKLEENETARVAAQRESLGEEGLKKLEERLTAAKAENDKEIPQELLEKFRVPSPDSVHFIPTITASGGKAKEVYKHENSIQELIDSDKARHDVFLHFEHVPSNFVHISLVLNTHAIPVPLRPLLTLYLDNFFNTPLLRGGKRIEFEEVVMLLEKDTVGYENGPATNLRNSELVRFSIQVEPDKYQAAIDWLNDLLNHGILDKVRLEASLAKILSDIPNEKRDGADMADSVAEIIQYSRKSSTRAQNTLVKSVYLKRIRTLLESDPERVIKDLEQIRHVLTETSELRVLVIGDFENGVKQPSSAWDDFCQSSQKGAREQKPLDSKKACLSDVGTTPGSAAYVVPIPAIDSSFARLSARGIDSWDHPLLPALTVAFAYLDAAEGPLWKAVRGAGLAYGTGFIRESSSGLISYKIYRSPDAYKAYLASKSAIEDLVFGKVEIDKLMLDGAVSSIVVNFAEEQPTMATAAASSFVLQIIRGLPKDWNKIFMERVGSVTIEDMRQALRDFALPVFDPKYANLFVTCASIMQDKLAEAFQREGFGVEIKPLNHFSDNYGLEGAEEDDDDSDDDSDEEEDEEEDDYDDEDDNNDDNDE